MTETPSDASNGRRLFATGLAGAALTAAWAAASASHPASEGEPDARKGGGTTRLPVVFLPHGGGPWPFVETGIGTRAEQDALAAYLGALGALARPTALLVVSAHWEEPVPTVMSGARPPLLYDYYGFPPASYEIQWPAPGHPGLAERVRALLGQAGFETASNGERGFDHGTFVPLKLAFPAADVPVVQLSLVQGLDPATHLALGRALAPLRDEGVLIVGSGMTYHNLRAFNPGARAVAQEFDAWLRKAMAAPPAERDRELAAWAKAPSARGAHPREEHLLPLMVVAGAAGGDPSRLAYDGSILGLPISAFHLG